jgi:hypothetical protein
VTKETELNSWPVVIVWEQIIGQCSFIWHKDEGRSCEIFFYLFPARTIDHNWHKVSLKEAKSCVE